MLSVAAAEYPGNGSQGQAMYQWQFREKRVGDDIADPIGGEFFADGSLENLAVALVREALQNALDAGTGIDRAGGPVRVRLALRRGEFAPSPAAARAWFGGLNAHLAAPKNGLKDPPGFGEICDCLVVEDFGTSGLTGDTDSDDADGRRNNFVDFLRSDGRTRKGEGDRGSWGVGKNVFPRASRVNGYLAYTVRRDDGRGLVMGKSILKIRRVAGEQWQPQCYLAASWRDGEVPKPLNDTAAADALRRDFGVTRRPDEPGLSLVMPWVDSEIDFATLRKAVVDEFYYAILAGALAVTLADGDAEVALGPDDVAAVVADAVPERAADVRLAAFALGVEDDARVTLAPPEADVPQRWSAELVPEAARTAVADALLARRAVAVRVPLHVRGAGAAAEPTATFFDVYLDHDDDARTARPRFFREQLAISGVKRAVGVAKVRSLVVIGDEPLAALLRAAEPPNHTDWDPKTANFRKSFRDGNHVITFVKSAVKQIVQFVRAGDDKPDAGVTLDYFSRPTPQDRPSPPRPGGSTNRAGDEPDAGDDDFPDAGRHGFRIGPEAGGFTLRHGGPDTLPPAEIEVVVAYDVTAGSPWKRYEATDFDLQSPGRSGVQILCAGGADGYAVVDSNRLRVAVSGRPFEVIVSGFDPNRDLIVRAFDPANPQEMPDADTETELHAAAQAPA